MKIIAHRGSNQKAHENSPLAFEIAIQEQADRLELDVQYTKDNEIIIYHDSGLHIGQNFVPFVEMDYLIAKNLIKERFGYELLTIEQCLDLYLSKIEINIEIKPNCLPLFTKLSQILNQSQLKDKIILSSFLEEPLIYFKESNPKIQRACLVHFNNIKQWPNSFSNVVPTNFMSKINTKIIHPYYKLVNEHFMEVASIKQWIVYPWMGMADEPSEMRESVWEELFNNPIDGLCTNCPAELKTWLEEKSSSHKPEKIGQKIKKNSTYDSTIRSAATIVVEGSRKKNDWLLLFQYNLF